MSDFGIRRYRTVFISDIHLGTKGCQAELLLDFIRHIECDHLFLVGDIIDGWKLRSGWHWPQSHNDVVQKVLRMARKGVNVTYVPGNHDEGAREFIGGHFGGVVVAWLKGRKSSYQATRGAFHAVMAMLLAQMVLGIVTALMAAHFHVAITHQIGAVILWVLILRARHLSQYPMAGSIREGTA